MKAANTCSFSFFFFSSLEAFSPEFWIKKNNNKTKTKKRGLMCLFSACCFHLYSVCLNKASAAESVKSGSQRSHRGLFAQMCCLPTCSRCLRCPPAVYKSLPLRLTAPLRAPRAHTSEPEVLISERKTQSFAHFRLPVTTGDAALFHFFEKCFFFF